MKTEMFSQDIKLKVAGVKSGIFNMYVITFEACKSEEIAYSHNLITIHLYLLIILSVTFNQDRMIFANFSVNFEPISLKFCKGYFLFKS